MHFPNGALQKPSFREIHEQTRKQNPPAWHSDLPQGKQKLPQMAIPIGTDTWKCSSSMIVMFAMIGMQNPQGTQTQSISNAIFFFACFFQIDIVRHNLERKTSTHRTCLAQPKSKFKPRAKQNPKSHQGFGRGIRRGTGRGTKVIGFDTLRRHAPREQRRRERRKKRKKKKRRNRRKIREKRQETREREREKRQREREREKKKREERQRDREVREERERERERNETTTCCQVKHQRN